MAALTREVTLYRLTDTDPDIDSLFALAGGTFLDEEGRSFDLSEAEFEGATALMFHWAQPPEIASWIHDAARLVGPLPHYQSQDSGGLLLIAVGDDTYAIGFGAGWRLLPDGLKDQRFGLRFTIRAVDPEQVRAIVRRSLTGIGRQDATHVPSGIPIGHIGVSEYSELVRRLAGKVDPEDLGLGGPKPVSVEGAAGLRLRIPLDPERLVTLLRRISEICAREVPNEFAFVEAIMPVKDADRRDLLDGALNERLRSADEGDPPMRLVEAVPSDLVDQLDDVQTYGIKIGSTKERHVPHGVDLTDILDRCMVVRSARPIEALRRGVVIMYADGPSWRENGLPRKELGRARADRWLEVSTVLNDTQYFLIEGDWYEGGTEYFASVRRQSAGYFPKRPGIVMPPWEEAIARSTLDEKKRGEPRYNDGVERLVGPEKMLNLDQKFIGAGFHGSKGFEACDLLGPDNELIHVKAGKGTGTFSHQFSQGLISTEALFLRPEFRTELAERVHQASFGARTLPADWRPAKVVFAMMIDRKSDLTPDSLFPHAQIALTHVAATLKNRFGVEVEVIAIPRNA
ncbi:DUF6119 family protein [Thermomonospora umbrina]|uniref:Uncharacterized protein (TIGR04141 family) n=1 Tax=Thermomonospora umbrina TaxID=111806 RepID=A0A3D9SJ85_9ACTN|nr:DUF6119 family protein [Thermomonospora umbrina]REE95982.1 uncharacterized protein (TIGR04141 family) [Thermomonospora umbrina]